MGANKQIIVLLLVAFCAVASAIYGGNCATDGDCIDTGAHCVGTTCGCVIDNECSVGESCASDVCGLTATTEEPTTEEPTTEVPTTEEPTTEEPTTVEPTTEEPTTEEPTTEEPTTEQPTTVEATTEEPTTEEPTTAEPTTEEPTTEEPTTEQPTTTEVATSAPATCVHGTKIHGGQCVCESGHSGVLCDVVGACSPFTAVQQHEEHYPVLDTSSDSSVMFTGNHLKLAIHGAVVKDRVYTDLKFKPNATAGVPTADQCSLGTVGSMWQTTLEGSCMDRFELDMPWARHTECGFFRTDATNGTFARYKGTMMLSYTDQVGDFLGTYFSRRVVAFYEVFVTFPLILEVEVVGVIIHSQIALRFALTQFTYDPVALEITVGVSTLINWPNRLLDDTMDITLPSENYEIGAVPLHMDSSDCVNTEGSVCKQIFTFSEYIVSEGCTFDGAYILNFTVATCRDADPHHCTYEPIGIEFTVVGSDICGQASITPIAEGKLIAVEDDISTPKDMSSEFLLGTMAYFRTVITTGGEDNDITMVYTDVSVEETGVSASKMQILALGVNNTMYSTDMRFTVDNSRFMFGVFLTGKHYQVLPGETKSYTFRATGRITFSGNENGKRTETNFESVWQAPVDSIMKSSTKVGIAGAVTKSNDKSAAPTTVGSQLTLMVVLPIAGVVVAVVVAVAAVLIKRRSANRSAGSFSTL